MKKIIFLVVALSILSCSENKLEWNFENASSTNFKTVQFGFSDTCFGTIQIAPKEIKKVTFSKNYSIRTDGSYYLRLQSEKLDTILNVGYYSNGQPLSNQLSLKIIDDRNAIQVIEQ